MLRITKMKRIAKMKCGAVVDRACGLAGGTGTENLAFW